jgi:hypothetical protein
VRLELLLPKTPQNGSPTSENAQKTNFAELRYGEVRRTLLFQCS